ncbi:hypothetical protein BKA04_001163 [Cryobacterium mesophilum]|uniref:Uncharacterized protein n=1 Tax=Terrimesophilobacter mesophilus TaxID=433647 RepID=A0A4R8VCC1_9MICO|nr:hypothetical protein [Terrimesophilobacter mesophilus]MBB5632940.1 hypothetical protein [Terrimesophilobacter mesophilus]TFB79712.1 hypothetical protein E3N84_06445 [Terrimesophilobacter mesophilus]
MFLKKLVPTPSDRGSALVAVIGVFAIGIILTTLIAAAVVHGLGWSTYSRASVQSHAAADAGIVAARAGLYQPGNCTSQPTSGVYVSAGSPQYRAVVEHNDGAGWVAGCPTASTSQVRITSLGTAESPAVAGISAGDTSTVEAVFQFLVPGINPTGVALYVYDGLEIEANSALDLSEGGSTGLIVKNGDLLCSKNNTVINGSIVVLGNMTFANKCTVSGSAQVEDLATMSSGRVDGDLIAGSVDPNPPGVHVGGTYTQSSVVPSAPDWTNLTYKPSDWVTSDGTPFEVQTFPVSCKFSSGNLGGTVAGFPLILNALSTCPSGITANNNTTVSLTSDVVVFGNMFNFAATNSLTFKSSTTAAHRLWFITPDNGPADDKAPTCAANQGSFSVNNSFAIQEPISSLLYTPCSFDGKNGFAWNGQIYAGGESYAKNNPSFSFVPVGAAGVDFDNAIVTPVISKPQPGSLLSMRDRNAG